MFSGGSQRVADAKEKASFGMKLAVTLGFAALCLTPAASVLAAPPAVPTETARLAGLCKVWGVVKYFHPYLGYQAIDWDKALVVAIPKVRAAKTSAEYADAVDSLLATLHDPNTHVIRPPAPILGSNTEAGKPGPAPPLLGAGGILKQPSVQILPDGTAVITATDYTQFNDYAAIGAFDKSLQGAKSAKVLVFDLRRRGGPTGGLGEFVLSQALIRTLPGLLSKPLALPVSRHRMHSGYVPDDGDNHGGYYSALVIQQGRFLPASEDPETRVKPMAFVLNAGSADIHDILGGMQAAHLATIIYEGPSGEESGVDTQMVSLPGDLTAEVRLSETVNPNGTLGFRPDTVVPAGIGAGSDPAMAAALKAVHTLGTAAAGAVMDAPSLYEAAVPESDYAVMEFPSSEYRLLSLFRFWNLVNTVYPYKDLIGRPWDDVLTEYIPKMEANADAHAYGVTAAEMITELHDSHGYATIPALMKDGISMPPVVLREAEGQTVVAALPDPKAVPDLHIGDIVMSVDGESVAVRRTRLGRRVCASTPQSLRLAVSSILLNGHKEVPAVLTVTDATGKSHTLTLPRTTRYVQMPPRLTPVYSVMPSGFGYIDLGRLTPADVEKAFQAVAKTQGLIFDMRGYPNGTAWAIAPYLASHPVVGAQFAVPSPQAPDDTSVSTSEYQIIPNPNFHYGGRVAVLIDETAISQAEHTCLFIEAACHPEFIGTPTAGANGEVTNAVLPGGISFSFTGMSIKHGDGRQLQRLGIQPTLTVAPTLAGIRAGRDEVLDAAVRRLTQ